jgi:hypothetical protein
VLPCNSNWCRCLADTATRFAFLLNISIFGTRQAHFLEQYVNG